LLVVQLEQWVRGALETIWGLIWWPDPAGRALSVRCTLEFYNEQTIWYVIMQG
jgi:hypothetical protein